MNSLTDFFIRNRDILLFANGLVYFTLGIAILLQAWQSYKLDLARSLRWLAAFGVLHGFYEWGNLFIPIQAGSLDQDLPRILNVVQLILLAASFACLFEFGVALLHPLGSARWLYGIPAGIFAIWAFIIFLVLLPRMPSLTDWSRSANALARYFIGLPGGLLAAYGLRTHTLQRIKPLKVPIIVGTLRVASVSLAIYALLAGFIPPAVRFFPGSWINAQTFQDAVGIPVLVFLSLAGLVVAVMIIRGLEVFIVVTDRRIESLEQQQIITTEHERMARELHDGTIQKVYSAGLLVESAARLVNTNPEITLTLKRAEAVLNDAIADLYISLSDLGGKPALQSESLLHILQYFAKDSQYNTLVQISLVTIINDHKELPAIRAGHLKAIINEALANITRHAQAHKVVLKAMDIGENLQVIIEDDGIGLSDENRAGYGLRNMRDRARLLNGRLEFSNPKGGGTIVHLEIPWVD